MSKQIIATPEEIEEALKGSGLTITEFFHRLTRIKSENKDEEI